MSKNVIVIITPIEDLMIGHKPPDELATEYDSAYAELINPLNDTNE